ncbi:MAG: hypothetical protein QXR05_04250 [Candidatus Methanomethylicia archaeon]
MMPYELGPLTHTVSKSRIHRANMMATTSPALMFTIKHILCIVYIIYLLTYIYNTYTTTTVTRDKYSKQ